MPTLRFIDFAHDSETLKPATIEQLRADLDHPIIKVYVYVGDETEPGWKAAQPICAIHLINLYLASDMSLVREWVPAGTAKGIVFGKDHQPDRLLNEAEASVKDIVEDANVDAP